MKIVLELTEREIKMLKFIIGNTFPEHTKFSKMKKKNQVDSLKANIGVAITTLYLKELSYLNQGEEHDGKELTKEI